MSEGKGCQSLGKTQKYKLTHTIAAHKAEIVPTGSNPRGEVGGGVMVTQANTSSTIFPKMKIVFKIQY